MDTTETYCPLCQPMVGNTDAVRCSICDKPLCVEHIRFTWDTKLKKAIRYYCPEHCPEHKVMNNGHN